MITPNRRLFLKGIGASALVSSAMTGIPAAFSAHAADVSGYKALVCVFLLGGLDSHDVLLPSDAASYEDFRRIRQSFLSVQGASRARENLLTLNPTNAASLGGRQMALPPEMPMLKSLFDQGDAAIVSNVGPLIEPTTRTTFDNGAARLPARLFSHNDQQVTWQASAPEGAQFGWGGLFADAVLAAGANGGSAQFATIASEEVGPFLTGRTAFPYRVTTDGAPTAELIEDLNFGASGDERAFLERVRAQLRSTSFRGDHVLEQDVANAVRNGLDNNETFIQARQAGGSALNTAFPASPLANQLRAVAQTIAVRSSLQADRQIYYVGLGGFDTHSEQARTLPALLGQIDGAVSAFHSAMGELGLLQEVTLFTATDFGRTLAVNGDGTDHGWGGHQFVVGGAVKGNTIYGQVPPSTVGHDADTGGGRLIPTISVEQYAAPLGRWFGLTDAELAVALPNLRNFDSNTIDIL